VGVDHHPGASLGIAVTAPVEPAGGAGKGPRLLDTSLLGPLRWPPGGSAPRICRRCRSAPHSMPPALAARGREGPTAPPGPDSPDGARVSAAIRSPAIPTRSPCFLVRRADDGCAVSTLRVGRRDPHRAPARPFPRTAGSLCFGAGEGLMKCTPRAARLGCAHPVIAFSVARTGARPRIAVSWRGSWPTGSLRDAVPRPPAARSQCWSAAVWARRLCCLRRLNDCPRCLGFARQPISFGGLPFQSGQHFGRRHLE
jgi:hypothetical protein